MAFNTCFSQHTRKPFPFQKLGPQVPHHPLTLCSDWFRDFAWLQDEGERLCSWAWVMFNLGLNYYCCWGHLKELSNIRNGRETESRWPQAASPPFQSRRKSVNQSYFCAQMVCFGNRHKQDSSGNCNTARGVTHLQQTKTTPLFFDADRLTCQAWRTLWFLQLQTVKPSDKTTNTASEDLQRGQSGASSWPIPQLLLL